MYPRQLQIPSPTTVLAYHKELQQKTQRRDLREVYLTQKRYSAKRLKLKSLSSKLALLVANIMIQAGYQLKKRYQAA